MLALPPGTHVWIAAGVTDMRKAANSRAALPENQLKLDPFSDHLFVLRGRCGHLLKIIWWEGYYGSGAYLFT